MFLCLIPYASWFLPRVCHVLCSIAIACLIFRAPCFKSRPYVIACVMFQTLCFKPRVLCPYDYFVFGVSPMCFVSQVMYINVLMFVACHVFCSLCPAFYVWFNDSCVELVQKNSECIARPDVSLCCWQDVKRLNYKYCVLCSNVYRMSCISSSTSVVDWA